MTSWRLSLVFAGAVATTATLFNLFAEQIIEFNAGVRTLIMTGKLETREFSEDGIPLYRNPRIGEYRSPFYVVHYGLEYSEACRSQIASPDQYHWFEDTTLEYWHSSPLKPSIALFRNSVDWVMDNIEYDHNGNAHLFYHFDWPYRKHPGGVLRAPWWSGLTEGHAITLLLRAADCFQERKYADAAAELYQSVLTPVEEGGSLLLFNDTPWIEEYVDPNSDTAKLSRVFNGMVYAYFGIRAFESHIGSVDAAPRLRAAIQKNQTEFDMGFWSYYDAIGSSANIKYHRINLALLKDPRLAEISDPELIYRWQVGATLPVVFFLAQGPNSFAKLHFLLMFIFCILLPFLWVRK